MDNIILLADKDGKVVRVFRVPIVEFNTRVEKELLDLAALKKFQVEIHPSMRTDIEGLMDGVRSMVYE